MSQNGGRAGDSEARTWTVLELLRWTTEYFGSRGVETPRLDAEVLLAHALGLRRLDLYVEFERPVVPRERAGFRELVVRRVSERVPVSILVGEKEFWSQRFRVTTDVLTPRPDTETLVEGALARMPDATRAYRVLDVGTGCGAIALVLAKERPAARVTATDISPQALQIARFNAEELQVSQGVEFLAGSLFEPIGDMQFDLVVSNPPYLARRDSADLPAELEHEPELALFGGEDGYRVLEPLAAQVVERIRPGGWVLVEVDPSQAETVVGWFRSSGLEDTGTLRDLAGRERVVVACRPEAEKQAEKTRPEDASKERGGLDDVAP